MYIYLSNSLSLYMYIYIYIYIYVSRSPPEAAKAEMASPEWPENEAAGTRRREMITINK